MSFILNKILNLDKYGEEWKGCYIKLREPTVEEMQRLNASSDEDKVVESVEQVKSLVQKCFVEGKGFNGEKIVSVKSVSTLPYTIYKECVDFLLSGQQDSKTDTSE